MLAPTPKPRFQFVRTWYRSSTAVLKKVPTTVYILIAMLVAAALILIGAHALASPMDVEERQSCPKIHVFGARETTAPAGFGTAGTVVNLVLQAYPGATSEAISYPACGGQSSCGGASYANSALQGTAAVAKAVNAFNTKCPDTQLVLVGYSQVCG